MALWRTDPGRLQARLRAAAGANGETLTGFVLAAAAERAEAVLQRAETHNRRCRGVSSLRLRWT
ncbi:MAG: hypothetical protein QOK39_594, partial [Acidimicrobiaceae bacterium]|nr:hypothetical protein [Acidimicrobiaceae bacterium]